MIGNGPNSAMYVGSAGQLIAGSTQEELFIQGKSFSWEDRLTFGAGETKAIVFDRSLYTGPNLTFLPLIFGADAGPILIDLYTLPTFDILDGTLLMASNRREGMPAPKGGLWLFDPTDIILGTRFSGDTVFATGTGVGNTNPGSNLEGLPFEIITDKALLLTNSDGAGTIVQFKFTWFEV